MDRVQIKGHNGIYSVTKDGRVFSSHSGREMKYETRRGYKELQLNGGTRRYTGVHRLVAETFIPNPENKPFVNHIDGNGLNNHIDNLEWCTPAENSKHARDTGLDPTHVEVPVLCVETGIQYPALVEAAKAMNINVGNICRSYKSNGRLKAKGFSFIKIEHFHLQFIEK